LYHFSGYQQGDEPARRARQLLEAKGKRRKALCQPTVAMLTWPLRVIVTLSFEG
jgi:hypothetical protein